MRPLYKAFVPTAAIAVLAAIAGCGSQGVEGAERGAQLFAQRCGGCHTLSQAGTQGSLSRVADKPRLNGPNLDQRKVTAPDVLYAIRNGGASGAIMPQNIVVGEDAQAVAHFVASVAGSKVPGTTAPGG